MGRDEFEAYLDELDDKITIDDDGFIRAKFNTVYAVKLSSCKLPEQVEFHAKALSVLLLDSKFHFISYIVRRFVRVLSEYHRLVYDFEPFCRSISISEIHHESKPQYLEIFNSQESYAALKIESGFNPFVYFERDFNAEDAFVKVTKPLEDWCGWSNEIFTAHTKRLNLICTPNYMLIEIFPLNGWTTSINIPLTEVGVNKYNKYGTRFVLYKNIWLDDKEKIYNAFDVIFKGLTFNIKEK